MELPDALKTTDKLNNTCVMFDVETGVDTKLKWMWELLKTMLNPTAFMQR